MQPGYPGIPPIDARSRGRGPAAWLVPVLLLAVLAAIGGAALYAHNAMGRRTEAVEAAWAQVESSLQRRADLVPRLVQVVKRAARHESEVLERVAARRSEATAALAGALEAAERARREREARGSGPPTKEAELAALAREDVAMGRGVRAVLAVAESYPALRATDAFLELQAQLEGTENRIHAARMAFNEAVRAYNSARVELPTSLVAQTRGLERRPYFRAAQGTHVAGSLELE